MWALQRIGTLPHPHTRACSRHDPPNSGVAAHTANSFTRLCHSTLRHASIASHVEASSAPFVGAGPGSQPSQAAGVSPQQTATRQQSGEPVSTPATRQPTESENRRSRPHSAAASNSSGGGSEGREDAGLLGGGHSSGHGRSGGGGGNSGSGGGGTGPGPGPDGGGDDGDAKGTPANRYPTWLRAWLIACGAVYLLLLRPRLFAERDERKRHMEREAAEFAKYEEDWDRLVASYKAKEEGAGKGGKAKPAQQLK
ncbi:hypothetical protein CHLRE_01g022283v5 [Chlamydomonas reinhardtii]|uniref:Uncharacterized protein n=1 Tax=Chlamydomonas reinhardtii TaxID=3055 RepID=A0A2K3E680_CHLRE|nr:uncharacterized protein CHLRE_01g022283v5 [Chlamydomonas reinhardtii]XP_042928407.1 uncharacterized protein CHLRE_01g022283v5 [Chlamydomonas reinhardtii]PNW88274.1 hypothetical protein CHLRE_01g022283v5 [Chlamydomonas reinhardtii]PNW88275.1 hypothetical protein CHLRE_01g022283v5 [Chlamydomonas reinhardtii]